MSEFPYPYICSLSPLCRAAVNAMGAHDGMRRMVEDLVKDIVARDDVANSLKIPLAGAQPMRQIDIRKTPNDPVMFKCFIGWNGPMNAWQVMVEGPNEEIWEKRKVPEGVN